jgi:hypothetical protein
LPGTDSKQAAARRNGFDPAHSLGSAEGQNSIDEICVIVDID